jgi:hypothetical protein
VHLVGEGVEDGEDKEDGGEGEEDRGGAIA